MTEQTINTEGSNKLKIARIVWEDHASLGEGSWVGWEDIEAFDSPVICESVGHILRDLPGVYVISQTISSQTEVIAPMMILKSAIKEFEIIA